MTHRGNRIKKYREKAKIDKNTLVKELGINKYWYSDLELVDNEITNTLSLHQVIKLANLLNTTPRTIIADDESKVVNKPEVPPNQLVVIIEKYIKENKINLEQFEDLVGWEIKWFLDEPTKLYDEPAIFLQDLCEVLDINWLDLVPASNRL